MSDRVFVWVDDAVKLLPGDDLCVDGCGLCRVISVCGSGYEKPCLVECRRVTLLERLRDRLVPRWFAYGH